MIKQAKISIVGAGPGDPELISLKAVKALASADVILYDALVHPSLLEYAHANCVHIFVGKRVGNHTFTQDEINQKLVESAYKYGHAVRLKGGDPFVFGRGHEELSYAESFSIETILIPGISSAIAVPELQKIPLTRRGVSESFTVVTATSSNGELSKDIYRSVQSDSTLVILMGMNKLKEISLLYTNMNREEIPCAIIQNGSLPEEKITIGRIGNILERVKEDKMGSPAVIVIGEVVALHPDFSKFEEEVSFINKISRNKE